MQQYLPDIRRPSDYEQRALQGILDWRVPEQTWFGKASESLQSKLSAVTDQLRKVPGVDWTIDNVVTGLVSVTNEIAQDLVWRDAIFDEYRKAGHAVHTCDDLVFLDLEEVDRQLDGLAAKYKSLAAVEGVATGIAGFAGILPDIVALITMNLRAAGEYATYCGFDISLPEERLYALHILDAAAKPRESLGPALLHELHEAPNRFARAKTLKTLESFAVSGTVRTIAKSVAMRITKSKLAQVMPVAGAVIAGGYNSLYTHTVCDVAHHLYRERFLFGKYGGGVMG